MASLTLVSCHIPPRPVALGRMKLEAGARNHFHFTAPAAEAGTPLRISGEDVPDDLLFGKAGPRVTVRLTNHGDQPRSTGAWEGDDFGARQLAPERTITSYSGPLGTLVEYGRRSPPLGIGSEGHGAFSLDIRFHDVGRDFDGSTFLLLTAPDLNPL